MIRINRKKIQEELSRVLTLLNKEDAEWNDVWHMMPKDDDDFDFHHHRAAKNKSQAIRILENVIESLKTSSRIG